MTPTVRDAGHTGQGKRIVATLSHELAGVFGDSYPEAILRRPAKFAQTLVDAEILVTLSRQLRFQTLPLVSRLFEDGRR